MQARGFRSSVLYQHFVRPESFICIQETVSKACVINLVCINRTNFHITKTPLSVPRRFINMRVTFSNRNQGAKNFRLEKDNSTWNQPNFSISRLFGCDNPGVRSTRLFLPGFLPSLGLDDRHRDPRGHLQPRVLHLLHRSPQPQETRDRVLLLQGRLVQLGPRLIWKSCLSNDFGFSSVGLECRKVLSRKVFTIFKKKKTIFLLWQYNCQFWNWINFCQISFYKIRKGLRVKILSAIKNWCVWMTLGILKWLLPSCWTRPSTRIRRPLSWAWWLRARGSWTWTWAWRRAKEPACPQSQH